MTRDDRSSDTPPRILVVDHDELERLLIKHRFRLDRLHLIEAVDGRSALEAAWSTDLDLILLDLHLPDQSGFEVIRRLKDDPRTRSVPVIFLSAISGSDDKVRALDLGAVDFVTKPFDPAELRARIRVALRMKSYHDLLEEQAQLDGLTGLSNRRALEQRLDAEWSVARRRGGPISLVIVDLDHFKRINDRFGHAAGDETLRTAALALKSVARSSDFVARFGGEEFVLIAPDADVEGAVQLAERVRERIESLAPTFENMPSSITASAGVASITAIDEEEASAHVLFDRADQALYAAKADGRNTVRVWNPTLRWASTRQRILSAAI